MAITKKPRKRYVPPVTPVVELPESILAVRRKQKAAASRNRKNRRIAVLTGHVADDAARSAYDLAARANRARALERLRPANEVVAGFKSLAREAHALNDPIIADLNARLAREVKPAYPSPAEIKEIRVLHDDVWPRAIAAKDQNRLYDYAVKEAKRAARPAKAAARLARQAQKGGLDRALKTKVAPRFMEKAADFARKYLPVPAKGAYAGTLTGKVAGSATKYTAKAAGIAAKYTAKAAGKAANAVPTVLEATAKVLTKGNMNLASRVVRAGARFTKIGPIGFAVGSTLDAAASGLEYLADRDVVLGRGESEVDYKDGLYAAGDTNDRGRHVYYEDPTGTLGWKAVATKGYAREVVKSAARLVSFGFAGNGDDTFVDQWFGDQGTDRRGRERVVDENAAYARAVEEAAITGRGNDEFGIVALRDERGHAAYGEPEIARRRAESMAANAYVKRTAESARDWIARASSSNLSADNMRQMLAEAREERRRLYEKADNPDAYEDARLDVERVGSRESYAAAVVNNANARFAKKIAPLLRNREAAAQVMKGNRDALYSLYTGGSFDQAGRDIEDLGGRNVYSKFVKDWYKLTDEEALTMDLDEFTTRFGDDLSSVNARRKAEYEKALADREAARAKAAERARQEALVVSPGPPAVEPILPDVPLSPVRASIVLPEEED